LGIILGLCVGKVAGISLSILICNRLRIVRIPREWDLSHIIGVGFLGGIGFTMSIFISILAFGAGTPITYATMIAIFTGSLISGICGYVILWMKGHDKNKPLKKIKYMIPR
ncbi:MAG TPA: Na+/H+ antiporter NhaA, partial [Spirochaetota bacterium]|nr:Na+/H+ antiporter NhaA [Spirochaetota bacterium]